MEWIENGKLLRAAEEAGFEVFVTGDQTLHLEQKLTGRALAIVALSAVEWQIIRDYLPQIVEAIDNALRPGYFELVDCGHFTRRKHPRD